MNNIVQTLTFHRRPSPVLPEHRILYKIAQLVLMLHLASRGSKSRLVRLHLLNWALKTPERRARLISDSKIGALSVEAWGFDPALSMATRFAQAEGVIEARADICQLSDTGAVFAKYLLEDEALLFQEKTFLASISKKITEGMVNDISRGWGA